jgi:hypothetical protein
MGTPSWKNDFLIQSIHAKFRTEINKRRYTGSIPLFNIRNIASKLLLPIGFSKPIVRFFEAVNQDIPDCGSLHNSVLKKPVTTFCNHGIIFSLIKFMPMPGLYWRMPILESAWVAELKQ